MIVAVDGGGSDLVLAILAWAMVLIAIHRHGERKGWWK